MRNFKYHGVKTVEEAGVMLRKNPGKAKIIAGGTDLLGILKGEILPDYPDMVVDIGKISKLVGVSGNKNELLIGPLTKLEEVGSSDLIQKYYGVLSQAARSVASPQIRTMGTIGGNLCQSVRCWYFRAQGLGNPYICIRKGGDTCFAMMGDNRFHAIMKGGPCFAVCPSDTAAALLALDGKVKTYSANGKGRLIPVGELYSNSGSKLEADEIVSAIKVSGPPQDAHQSYQKFRLREAIDFAVVSVASVVVIENGTCKYARIVLGGVAPMPIRLVKAEEKMLGRLVDKINISDVAETALTDAEPMSHNGYKVEIAKTLIKRSILASMRK